MRSRVGVLVGSMVLVAVACGGDPGPVADSGEVLSAQAELDAVAAADVAAYGARDAEAERALYAEDVEIVDGDEGLVGIDDLVWVAEFLWEQYPEYGEAHAGTWVGATDGIVLIDQWGFEGFTEAEPLHEYRILEVEDGVVSHWIAIYDLETRPYFGTGGMDDAAAVLLARYEEAWNSGDAGAIEALYDPAALRSDLLFGVAEGDEVGDQIGRVLDHFGGWTLDPVATLGIRAHQRVGTGGVYTITGDGCAVEAVIYLESPDGALVTGEWLYYDADSLIACSWAG